MDKVLLVYAIVQLITTAFGLAVIESIKPIVEERLETSGYVKRNRNSLYNFNDSLINVLKGFIPFYYFSKAMTIISNKKSSIRRQMDEEIKNGNYYNPKNVPEIQVIEESPKSDVLVNNEAEVVFEKPEKYKARKNDISLYDTYETPVEYITRETTKEEELELTPYMADDKVVEHVVVKNDVTSADIAKAISELDIYELELLRDKLSILVENKKQDKGLTLEKDVA